MCRWHPQHAPAVLASPTQGSQARRVSASGRRRRHGCERGSRLRMRAHMQDHAPRRGRLLPSRACSSSWRGRRLRRLVPPLLRCPRRRPWFPAPSSRPQAPWRRASAGARRVVRSAAAAAAVRSPAEPRVRRAGAGAPPRRPAPVPVDAPGRSRCTPPCSGQGSEVQARGERRQSRHGGARAGRVVCQPTAALPLPRDCRYAHNGVKLSRPPPRCAPVLLHPPRARSRLCTCLGPQGAVLSATLIGCQRRIPLHRRSEG